MQMPLCENELPVKASIPDPYDWRWTSNTMWHAAGSSRIH